MAGNTELVRIESYFRFLNTDPEELGAVDAVELGVIEVVELGIVDAVELGSVELGVVKTVKIEVQFLNYAMSQFFKNGEIFLQKITPKICSQKW
jgi:hypothetical protein